MTSHLPFSVLVEPRSQACVLRLSGTVDRAAAESLDAAFHDACETGVPRLALDFGAIDYLNSTGIALIVDLLRRAGDLGLAVDAWGLSDHYREIFEITRLVEFMTLYDDETDAHAGA